MADISLRDTENVPLTEDIKEYFKREVLPYAPEAWIDEKKTASYGLIIYFPKKHVIPSFEALYSA